MEITHPFHPLRGQRFEVLKAKRCASDLVLSLKSATGTIFPVPRDWTDIAPPSPYEPGAEPILDAWLLLEMSQLVEDVRNRDQEVPSC